ncbi:OLC1v1014720C1 [Oldenlandia corymbosa var. corymbosa]|uniref:OLC1v1014720C1 n=1 Tax=Oldenlandia corymbosa var. corymbosa TaxID=529605 RepID=A0AAV1E1X2_OLDCO|nr:OLC1v1014720C1 [Oldenlandia corymbosa var. corymbosa]
MWKFHPSSEKEAVSDGSVIVGYKRSFDFQPFEQNSSLRNGPNGQWTMIEYCILVSPPPPITSCVNYTGYTETSWAAVASGGEGQPQPPRPSGIRGRGFPRGIRGSPGRVDPPSGGEAEAEPRLRSGTRGRGRTRVRGGSCRVDPRYSSFYTTCLVENEAGLMMIDNGMPASYASGFLVDKLGLPTTTLHPPRRVTLLNGKLSEGRQQQQVESKPLCLEPNLKKLSEEGQQEVESKPLCLEPDLKKSRVTEPSSYLSKFPLVDCLLRRFMPPN